MVIIDAIKDANKKLTGTVPFPLFEANLLLSYVLKKPRSFLYTHPEKILNEEEKTHFAHALARRMQGEPFAYISGTQGFWSIELMVNRHTLIPRPETELLIEAILDLPLDFNRSIKIADLGTGSGAIALALAKELPHATIIATDICSQALHMAAQNAKKLKIHNVAFYQGNWCDALPHQGFDIIVSNPPYIAQSEWQEYARGLVFEPVNALLAGSMGLDAIVPIIQSAKCYLKPDGHVLIEHGFAQEKMVCEYYAKQGYHNIHTIYDLANLPRISMAQW